MQPTVADVLFAARAYNFPLLRYGTNLFTDHRLIGPGESSWRLVISQMTDRERVDFWQWWGTVVAPYVLPVSRSR